MTCITTVNGQAGSEATNHGVGQSNLSKHIYVCLSVCNAQECKKYLIQHAGVDTHSVCGCTHKGNIILTITGHELLFILLHFMVQNDYGF